ncbi:hypothetical protein XENTR_v10024928 [Xenopus tropicalis]|uniref:Transmembrane protein 37 n=1 Tax=Xenopus tropicalis TaxID=8364 RepID=A0A803JT45_XENTR|nr:voltage-dependent calcium channel gamma-like subunit [Xenopus tropicalis]KAE8581749.1 hypothetical protein XENTR_v10024928 [Xenopus tropicalis]|eukprot:XP_004920377.1 PREDICTED: voltage-dependent calcium channel gamma-like subunit [Xenopus tropicalis]
MAAIGVQVQKPRLPHGTMFFEMFLRVLITVGSALAVILSSISVCDGRWVSAPEEPTFGVWDTCNQGSAQCGEDLMWLSQRMALVRTTVSVGVVVAIFGLELLMVSQLCEDGHAHRKWNMGSVLLLVSFLLSSTGTLTYVTLLMGTARLGTFTLLFWCQFVGVFLFFLNGISGIYFSRLAA